MVANASGAFPAIFIASANPFKVILKSAAGVTLDTIDRIPVGEVIDLETLGQFVDQAEDAAVRSEAAAAEAASVIIGNEFPVSYQAQPLSSAQQAQARENIHALPSDRPFQVSFETSPLPVGQSGAWELFFPHDEVAGISRDGILIHHDVRTPSSGIHILGTAVTGSTEGYSLGAAMSGPGSANAITGNRYEDGDGHGTTGNRVGTGDGFGGHFAFSSEGVGGALYAIKQNSGYTGLSGVGPALWVENLSNEGKAIESTTSSINASVISNTFTRGSGKGGVNADFLTTGADTRETAAIGQRIIMQPGAAWGGSPAVIGQEITIGANATGSVETRGLLVQNYSVGNTTAYGVFASAYGANDTNYGGYFQAGGGTNDIALRADGNAVITGSISKGSGTFLIDHPLDPFNKDLAHGFVEAPRYDLIYRGTAKLKRGKAEIDIDAASDMTGGTFAALTFNAVVTSLQNQDGFARLRPGEITGGTFEIICEDEDSTDLVSWVVIAERNDPFVKSDLDPNTDSEGRFVPEREKEE